jgi:hypothetical protein
MTKPSMKTAHWPSTARIPMLIRATATEVPERSFPPRIRIRSSILPRASLEVTAAPTIWRADDR